MLPASRIERDLGIDSLARTELILRIERAFHVRLPARTIGEAETVDDLLRALEQAAPGLGRATLEALPASVLPAVPAASEARTLVEVLEWHAARHADRLHLTVLQDEATVLGSLTYGALARRARDMACGLIARDVAPGDRVALMLPTSIEFFVAFFGILYAGAIPVPIYPPMRLSQLEDHLRRQTGILRNAGARMLITMPEGRQLAGLLRTLVESLGIVASVDEIETAASRGRSAPASRRECRRADPVHVRQHRRPQGGRAQSRQSARQHPRHGHGDGRELGRRLRQLAAALPRHGPDRRVARLPALCRAALCDVAVELPDPAAELALGDAPLSRDVLGVAEFRIRAVPRQDRRRGPRRPGSERVAHDRERRRAGQRADLAPVHRTVWPLRLCGGRDGASLRARRMLGRLGFPASRANPR